MKARALTQEFIDEWLGYFINPANKIMSSLLLGCGLPGGMMGSMMADLGGIRQTINNLRKKKGEEEISLDDMSCSVVLAPYTSYNFTFRCNASTLTDALKYDKRSGYSNAVQWY